jgi:outer membrane immunogenic protein
MTSLKALLLAATATLATSAALAADLPSRRAAPAPYAAVPAFTWTGFYVGVNAGAAFDTDSSRSISYGPDFGTTFNDATIAGFNRSNDEAGFTGGGQVGYNRQLGSWVVGLEADFNFVDLKDRRSGRFVGIGTSPAGADEDERLSGRRSVEWFGTVRGRLGFLPTERLMIYGTGGLAYGEVKTRATMRYINILPGFPDIDLTYAGSRSDIRVGYAVGGGLEYAITQNVSIKGEYLYVDLGRESVTGRYTGTEFITSPGDTFAVRDKASFSVARAGLNWKFNTFGF